MAKGPIITNQTRSRIADILLRNPTWIAKEIQAEVDRQMGGRGPSISAVQKELTRLRKRVAEAPASDLDKPWNLRTLSEYDLPPKIIPVLIEMQKFKRSEYGGIVMAELTVRQAIWVSRLYYLIEETYMRKFPQATAHLKRRPTKNDRSPLLWFVFAIAASYAHQEVLDELAGRESGDSDLDSEFFIDELYWERSVEARAEHYAAITSLSRSRVWRSDLAYDAIRKARRKERRSNELPDQKSQ